MFVLHNLFIYLLIYYYLFDNSVFTACSTDLYYADFVYDVILHSVK